MDSEEVFRRIARSRRRLSSQRIIAAPDAAGEEPDPIDVERAALWDEIDSTHRVEGDLPRDDDIKEAHGYTNLHALCAVSRNGPSDPKWEKVRQYLKNLSVDDAEKELRSTQKKGFSYTPLHVACFLSPPVDVVMQMVLLCPKSAEILTALGDTPLSLACGGFVPAGVDVVKELVKACPEARDTANNRKETPLHLHLKTTRKYDLNPCPVITNMLATAKAVNTRDVKGHSPLYYLGRAATEAFSFMAGCVRFFSSEEDSNQPNFELYKGCLGDIISQRPFESSKTLFLRDLIQFPHCLRDASFEKKGTREAINSIVGRGQYIALLLADIYVQLVIVVTFTLGCGNNFESTSYTTVLLAGSVYWLLKRFASAIGSTVRSINPFHTMTVMQAILLMASSLHLRKNQIDLVDEGESGPWRNVLIITSFMIWFTLMGIVCHTMKGFSVFVHATVQIFKKLVNLFLVFAVIFMGFSTMFLFSAVHTEYCAADPDEPGEYSGDYCTLKDAMEKTYSLFFGTLEADDFTSVPPPTLVTLIIFNIIVIILLLNIIIAVMSDCYADVESQAELVFWDHRFELITDVDAITNCITGLFGCCRTKKEPQSPEEEEQANEEHDVGTATLHWFGRLMHYKKENTTVPKPIMNMLTFALMGLWVVVGLFTFGLTWPRHARRKIFAPSVMDHLSSEDENESGAEVEKVKLLNKVLEDRISALRKENDELRRKMADALPNSPNTETAEAALE